MMLLLLKSIYILVELEDPVDNIGAKLVRQSASKTNDLAGDMTTRKFEDIFDVNHLIDYLKDDLQIVCCIPSLFAEKSKLFTSIRFPSRCYGPAILLMSEYLTRCLVTSGLRMWQLAPSCAQWFICLPAVKKVLPRGISVFEDIANDYDPDRQRAEDRKLKKLVKRKAKGVTRELTKDNYFLAEAKAQDKARLDAEKAEEHGRARAFLQEQDLDFFANTSTEMLELFNEEDHILDMKIVSGDYRLQEESIPIALTYSDILARAKNGIGKTTTFCIPAIDYQCTSWD
ncbi:nucleolar protein 14 [Tanacetum coccineum]